MAFIGFIVVFLFALACMFAGYAQFRLAAAFNADRREKVIGVGLICLGLICFYLAFKYAPFIIVWK